MAARTRVVWCSWAGARVVVRSAVLVVVVGTTATWLIGAQGVDSEGHPRAGGAGIFAAWNPAAGVGALGAPPRGWDYRINLPGTRFALANPRAHTGAAMVGVVEDAGHTTLQASQHVNNAVWVFAVDVAGDLRFKILPSRRSLQSNAVENVAQLTTDWLLVGPRGQDFLPETPAVAVLGEGIGVARLVVVARTADRRLLLTSRVVEAPHVTSWSQPWVEVAPRAGLRPTVAAASGGGAVIAWAVGAPSRVEARAFDPVANAFGPVTTVADGGGSPELLWDGTALHLFYIGPILEQAVWHTVASTTSPLGFAAPVRIGATVLNAQCDAMSFNRRLHIACTRLAQGRSRIWYSTSARGGLVGAPLGPLPWEPASHVGLDDHVEPAIGAVGDQIYVLGVTRDGILQSSRRDPHVRAYEWVGGLQPVERWLETGTDVDPSQRVRKLALDAPRVLSFNRDLYLTAAAKAGTASDGLYLMNFGRAAVKGFLERRLGIGLGWGDDGDVELMKPGADAVAAAGGHFFFSDVTNDGAADLVRAGIAPGGGELRVATALPALMALRPSSMWLAQFAMPDDIVHVGDVNGDGFRDVVRAFRANGHWSAEIAFVNGSGITFRLTVRDHRLTTGVDDRVVLGDVTRDGRDDLVIVRTGAMPSPVVVLPGRPGTEGFGSPREWAAAVAVSGDEPLLMDLDGNGSKDLVVVASGGGTPFVRAALSTGTAFDPPTQWAGAVANQCRSYAVGDMNQDTREDLLCFVRGLPGAAGHPRTAYVLFAEPGRFSLPTTLVSRFGGEDVLPLVGNLLLDSKGTYTSVPGDAMLPILDLLSIRLTDGRVAWRAGLGQFPVPSGIAWENYRFFTEKGVGALMLPDFLWRGTPCVRRGHLFLLLGAAGSGSPDVTRLSVRPGSAEAHVLEELGHSVFFNCFRDTNDPLGMTGDIFTRPLADGGFEANAFAADTCQGAAASWIDCRDAEHFFLRFMLTYRTHGGLIRTTIANETDPARRARYQARYNWLKKHWFGGAEFYKDATVTEARRDTVGLPCLRDQCAGVRQPR